MHRSQESTFSKCLLFYCILFCTLRLVVSDTMPRRPKFPCTVCAYACKVNSKSIACDDCNKWTHKDCIGMSTVSYDRLGNSDEQWFCPSCNSQNNSTKIYNTPTLPASNNETTNTHNLPTSPQTNAQENSISSDQSTPSDISSAGLNSTSDDSFNSTISGLGIAMTSSPKRNRETLSKAKGKGKTLRILNVNFQSAKKKGKFLEEVIESTDPDIIVGTETWLKEEFKTAELIPNHMEYDVYRRDRPKEENIITKPKAAKGRRRHKNKAYGGVLLAAKRELEMGEIEIAKNIELISGAVKLRNEKKVIIAAYYRPPNRTDIDYTSKSQEEFFKLRQKVKQNILIIGGDFNLPDIDWESETIVGNQYPHPVSQSLLDFVAEGNMEQQVDFHTRKDKTTLDLILTTHPSLKTCCKPLPSIGNSDHDMVLYDTCLKPNRPKPKKRKISLWKKANKVGIKEDLRVYAQSFKIEGDTQEAMDAAWKSVKDILHETEAKHVPTKTTNGKYSHPWIDTSLRRAMNKKNRAHAKQKKTNKKRDKDRYKRLQAECNDKVKKANRDYVDRVASDDDPKRFWAYVKSKGQDSQGVSPLKNSEGFLQSDSKKKADILNKQFQSVFTKEDTKSNPDKGESPYKDMQEIVITEQGVLKLLLDIDPKKATGPDNISAAILRTAAEELAPVYTKLFQLSLDTGYVPNDWKEAWVVPIFKKGERHLPSNYRPVSLTSITCKILEHIVHSSIMNHYEGSKILTDCQHGFRKKRSCETQLISLVHDITKSLEAGHQIDMILLDFSKAFDKVPHQRLLHKLNFYGVRNNTLRWIGSFLKDRSQNVVLEGEHSSKAPVLSGVPQGTVLGPLLFLTYINDLPEAISHSKTKLFADDSMIFKEIQKEQDQTKLQEDLDSLQLWESKWQMNFNPSKCTSMSANSGKKDTIPKDYFLHDQKLEKTKFSKYLGVTISEDMKWTQHTDLIASKGHRAVGFLRRNFSACSPKAKATTYTTMVRPVLEYASTVWDPSLRKDVQKLEKVQRSASRYVFNNYDRTPGTVTSLLNRLEWDTLEERREMSRLTMLFKIQNGLVDLNPSDYYSKSDSRTRGCKFNQVRAYNPAHINSFFPRTLSQWNKLPPGITTTETLQTFKTSVGCFRQTHTL